LTDTQWTSAKIAVDNFAYGSVPDADYSSGLPVLPKSAAIKTIYVLDKVTIPSVVGTPNAINVLAFGTVDVTATSEYNLISQEFQANTVGAFKLGSSSTVTSSTGNATIYVPKVNDFAVIPNIEVEADKPIFITSANSGSPVASGFKAYRVSGPGVLTLTNVSSNGLTVLKGDGNIVVAPSPATAPSFASVQIGDALNPVNVVFPQALTLTGAALIGGNVEFRAGVTTNDDLTLLGDVVLYNDLDATVDNDFGIVVAVVNKEISLAKGKSIVIGGGSYIGAKTAEDIVPKVPVLTAEEDTVLRTKDNTVKISSATAPNVSGKEDPVKVAAAYRVAIGGQLLIKKGGLLVNTALALPASAVLTTTAINNDPRIDGSLALADGALLALAADGSNPGKIIIGENEITGADTGNPSVLTASGGTITLKGDLISGPAQSKLTASVTAAVLDVKGDLALNAITLDAQTRGNVTLKAGKTIKLTNGAGLVFSADAGVPDTRRIILVGANRADISGGVVVNAATNKLVSITQSGTMDAVIKSRSADVTLSRSSTNLTAVQE
jgi:hypothetical protein